LILALIEALRAVQDDVLPAGDGLALQPVSPGDLGRAPRAREDFEDELGLELRREGPASAFRQG
jgi:hypothetical protein